MKIATLKQHDIESFIEQGANVEIKFLQNVGLPLDFSRGWSGYDYYEVIIDNKYKCMYQIRYKRDFNDYKVFLDKIEF